MNRKKKDIQKYVFIDPPSGWKYGFPKKFLASEVQEKGIPRVLKEAGYPENINSAFVRMWDEPNPNATCSNCKHFKKKGYKSGECTKKPRYLTDNRTSKQIKVNLPVEIYYSCDFFQQRKPKQGDLFED